MSIYLALWLFLVPPLAALAQTTEPPAATTAATTAEAAATAETPSTTGQAETPTASTPPYESRPMRNQNLLAQATPEQAQWLDTSQGKLLALYRRTEARKNYGALLLLHATEDPQSWPAELENLRLALPRYGWETLSLALPAQTPPSPPPRAEGNTPMAAENEPVAAAEPGATTTDPKPPANLPAAAPTQSASRTELINTYLEAAFTFLKQQNQYNLVLLVDNSAALDSLQALLPQIKSNPRDKDTIDGPFQALILINLQSQEALTSTQLESVFSVPNLPIMDIFLAPEDETQKNQRQLHHGIAMRNKLDKYRSELIIPQAQASIQDINSFLVHRVRGFMMLEAKGAEVRN